MRKDNRRISGLTLIELILVVTILGILFSVTTVSVVGLTPKYRVRSASRTLGAKIEELAALAVGTGQPVGIRYTLGHERHYYQLIPPPPPDYPDQPVEDRDLGSPTELPKGVFFRFVVLPSKRTITAPGAVNIMFSPMGNKGTHGITLEGRSTSGNVILNSLIYNAIIGSLIFEKEKVESAVVED